MKITKETIGNRLFLYRDELDMSQEYVSSKCNIKQSLLSKLEKGNASIDTLLSVLNFYSQFFDLSNFMGNTFVPLELSENQLNITPAERIEALSKQIAQIAQQI